MICESIKTILGGELSGKVEAALKGKGKEGKDIDLVVGNDGSFVPAEKYNGANSEKASAENALKAAAEALKAIGGSGDTKKIAEDIEAAKTQTSNLQENHNAEITKIQKTTALKMSLAGMAHDPSDIISRLDLEKIDIDENGALKSNIDDLVKPIREEKPYLFKEEEVKVPEIKGAKPASSGARQDPPAKVEGPFAI